MESAGKGVCITPPALRAPIEAEDCFMGYWGSGSVTTESPQRMT
jgi:hypothetical protein